MRTRLFVSIMIAWSLLAPSTPATLHAQSSAPPVQTVFLGDRTCGDAVFDCYFDGVAASNRYLHVVLFDSPGAGNWQVQAASTCSDGMPGLPGTSPISPRGYGEAVFDLQSAASQLLMQPACYVFRGLNGRQAVYYAAYFDGSPNPDAGQVFPGYQDMTGRPDLPDLDVAYISRSPRYAYDASPNAPSPGQPVTFTAHLTNSGGQPLPRFTYAWLLDGRIVQQGSSGAPLLPGEEQDVPFSWRWDPTPHELTFEASVDVPQISTANDHLQVRTDALALGFWIERSAYQYFRNYQWEYCRPLACGGSDSFEDWLQLQVSAWNRLLAGSIYPGFAPAGIADRIRVDEVTVVPDGSLPLAGGPATNSPDARDHTVDLEWGVPASGVGTAYSNQVDGAFDLDWGTIHELNHARSMADLYRFDIPLLPTNSIAVTGTDGRPIFDPAGPFDPNDKIRAFDADQGGEFLYQNREQDLMSCPCTPFYSLYSALVLNRLRGRRARCGNTNPPCNLGDWFSDIPRVNRLRLLDRSGRPVPDGTTVKLFYDTGTTYDGHSFDNAHSSSFTAHGGSIDLGPDPFHAHDSTWVEGHNLLLLEVRASQDEFCFLEPTVLNLAYWIGYRDAIHPAIYTLRLGREVQNGCDVSLPPTLINEPFATSPYRSQARLSAAHRDGGRLVRDLTIRLLDDARTPHPMARRRIEVRDSAGRIIARGASDTSGVLRLAVPAAATSISVQDVTDNHLQILADQ